MDALTALKIKIREIMNTLTDDMATGSCHSYSDYTHMTGQIKGLALAERELLDLQEKIEHDEYTT